MPWRCQILKWLRLYCWQLCVIARSDSPNCGAVKNIEGRARGQASLLQRQFKKSRMRMTVGQTTSEVLLGYRYVYSGACSGGSFVSSASVGSESACHSNAKNTDAVTYFSYASTNGECALYSGTCVGGDDREQYNTFNLEGDADAAALRTACDSIFSESRCWYLSEEGENCENTCAQHGFEYSFARPVEDMTPKLLGFEPAVKQDPWLFVECYVPKENRYHPYDPNAWGVPENTPADELAEAGRRNYPGCDLVCPCGLTTTTTTFSKCADGVGLNSADRCWYLSEKGASCDATCTNNGRVYSFAEPVEDMTPKLVGHTPTGVDFPWKYLECYVPNEDRYHPFNPNAWGVPGKTPPEELLEAGQHTYDNCQLACPCSAEPQTFPKCSDGVGLDSVQRCWYLSELGSSCDNTCASRGKYYSYAEPAQDMVPNLLGRAPAGKDNPWIFVECYVPSEDRYHPANNDAWGVPGKTPASEISEAGQHTYETCRLSCPCTSDLPATTEIFTTTTTTTTTTLPKCSDGKGLASAQRCWYLSDTGANCDDTCAASGRSYSFALPAQDMTPALIGHLPAGKDDPWIFLECYAAKEDRYHPVDPNAWGVPWKTPANELAEAGQHTYPTCRLACPCSQAITTTTTSTTTTPFPTCSDGVGLASVQRCWYLSETGGSCDATCAARGRSYSFASSTQDMTPSLIGHTPAGIDDPWIFLECYVPSEDRYHPANPNAWGVPEKTPANELPEAGQHTYPTCQLACPCSETLGVRTTTTTTAWPRCSDGRGLASVQRCWYLSDLGDHCDNTCGNYGRSYSFALPEKDMTPALIGHTPAGIDGPWIFVECYVPNEDRYHPVDPNAWGVPAQTPMNELPQAGQHTYPTCRLACPCSEALTSDPPDISTTTPPAVTMTTAKTFTPVVTSTQLVTSIPATTNSPSKITSSPFRAPPTQSTPQVPELGVQECSGILSGGRCWYLSVVGATCDDTCASHSCSYRFTPTAGDMTPKLLGRLPSARGEELGPIECYAPDTDMYFPYNPDSEILESVWTVGQYNRGTCRLTCSCVGSCVGSASARTSVPPVPPLVSVFTSTLAPVPLLTTSKILSLPDSSTAEVQSCSGILKGDRCWYLSALGASCQDTCAAHSCGYSFSSPPVGDMTPQLIGHVPSARRFPWTAVECYVPAADEYYPFNEDEASALKLKSAGQFSYETCRLSCPCAGSCIGDVPPMKPNKPTNPPVLSTQAPPSGTLGDQDAAEAAEDDDDGPNVKPERPSTTQAYNRSWYLSPAGGNCADTCAANGLTYSWAAPPDGETITPWLLSKEPIKANPWAFVECYVSADDTYHPVNRNAWGVPGADALATKEAASWSHDECQLACPCATSKTCRWEQPPACAPEFDWQGVLYKGCPSVDHDKPWCMHHKQHTEEGSDGEWSNCIYACDGDKTPVGNCKWVPADSCKQEFDYEGTHYVGCTSVDHDSPWCSNTHPYNKSWSHCKYQCTNPSAADAKTMRELNEGTLADNQLCSWQQPPACSAKFNYNGVDYEGCVLNDNPTPWCSHDRSHSGAWSNCERICQDVSR